MNLANYRFNSEIRGIFEIDNNSVVVTESEISFVNSAIFRHILPPFNFYIAPKYLLYQIKGKKNVFSLKNLYESEEVDQDEGELLGIFRNLYIFLRPKNILVFKGREMIQEYAFENIKEVILFNDLLFIAQNDNIIIYNGDIFQAYHFCGNYIKFNFESRLNNLLEIYHKLIEEDNLKSFSFDLNAESILDRDNIDMTSKNSFELEKSSKYEQTIPCFMNSVIVPDFKKKIAINHERLSKSSTNNLYTSHGNTQSISEEKLYPDHINLNENNQFDSETNFIDIFHDRKTDSHHRDDLFSCTREKGIVGMQKDLVFGQTQKIDLQKRPAGRILETPSLYYHNENSTKYKKFDMDETIDDKMLKNTVSNNTRNITEESFLHLKGFPTKFKNLENIDDNAETIYGSTKSYYSLHPSTSRIQDITCNTFNESKQYSRKINSIVSKSLEIMNTRDSNTHTNTNSDNPLFDRICEDFYFLDKEKRLSIKLIGKKLNDCHKSEKSQYQPHDCDYNSELEKSFKKLSENKWEYQLNDKNSFYENKNVSREPKHIQQFVKFTGACHHQTSIYSDPRLTDPYIFDVYSEESVKPGKITHRSLLHPTKSHFNTFEALYEPYSRFSGKRFDINELSASIDGFLLVYGGMAFYHNCFVGILTNTVEFIVHRIVMLITKEEATFLYALYIYHKNLKKALKSIRICLKSQENIIIWLWKNIMNQEDIFLPDFIDLILEICPLPHNKNFTNIKTFRKKFFGPPFTSFGCNCIFLNNFMNSHQDRHARASESLKNRSNREKCNYSIVEIRENNLCQTYKTSVCNRLHDRIKNHPNNRSKNSFTQKGQDLFVENSAKLSIEPFQLCCNHFNQHIDSLIYQPIQLRRTDSLDNPNNKNNVLQTGVNDFNPQNFIKDNSKILNLLKKGHHVFCESYWSLHFKRGLGIKTTDHSHVVNTSHLLLTKSHQNFESKAEFTPSLEVAEQKNNSMEHCGSFSTIFHEGVIDRQNPLMLELKALKREQCKNYEYLLLKTNHNQSTNQSFHSYNLSKFANNYTENMFQESHPTSSVLPNSLYNHTIHSQKESNAFTQCKSLGGCVLGNQNLDPNSKDFYFSSPDLSVRSKSVSKGHFYSIDNSIIISQKFDSVKINLFQVENPLNPGLLLERFLQDSRKYVPQNYTSSPYTNSYKKQERYEHIGSFMGENISPQYNVDVHILHEITNLLFQNDFQLTHLDETDVYKKGENTFYTRKSACLGRIYSSVESPDSSKLLVSSKSYQPITSDDSIFDPKNLFMTLFDIFNNCDLVYKYFKPKLKICHGEVYRSNYKMSKSMPSTNDSLKKIRKDKIHLYKFSTVENFAPDAAYLGNILGLGLAKQFSLEIFLQLEKPDSDDFVLFFLYVSLGFSYRSTWNFDFLEHFTEKYKSGLGLYAFLGLLMSISMIFENSGNLFILSILTDEINKRGCFTGPNNKGNKMWYDESFWDFIAICICLVSDHNTKPLKIRNKFHELIVNGYILSFSKKKLYAHGLLRDNESTLYEILYSALFIETIDFFRTPSDILHELNLEQILKYPDRLDVQEVYKISGKIYYICFWHLQNKHSDISNEIETLFEFFYFLEREIERIVELRVLFLVILICLSICLYATHDIRMIRILRRLIKKTESINNLPTLKDFLIPIKDTLQFGVRYGDMLVFKFCLGIISADPRTYIKFDKQTAINILATFFAKFPLSSHESVPSLVLRYFLINSISLKPEFEPLLNKKNFERKNEFNCTSPRKKSLADFYKFPHSLNCQSRIHQYSDLSISQEKISNVHEYCLFIQNFLKSQSSDEKPPQSNSVECYLSQKEMSLEEYVSKSNILCIKKSVDYEQKQNYIKITTHDILESWKQKNVESKAETSYFFKELEKIISQNKFTQVEGLKFNQYESLTVPFQISVRGNFLFSNNDYLFLDVFKNLTCISKKIYIDTFCDFYEKFDPREKLRIPFVILAYIFDIENKSH